MRAQGKQICVVQTKVDAPERLTASQLNTLLCLPELRTHMGKLTVIELSTASLQGVSELLRFVQQQAQDAPRPGLGRRLHSGVVSPLA